MASVEDVVKMPYAPRLEEMIRQIYELNPEKIGVCVLAGGVALTGYYGDVCHEDKAVMAYHMHIDAVMDTVRANAQDLLNPEKDEGEDA